MAKDCNKEKLCTCIIHKLNLTQLLINFWSYLHTVQGQVQEGGTHIYLLLTESEVCTVSYGPSFFLLMYGPSAKCAGHKSMGKQGSVTSSTDRENEVSKIFIISLRLIKETS